MHTLYSINIDIEDQFKCWSTTELSYDLPFAAMQQLHHTLSLATQLQKKRRGRGHSIQKMIRSAQGNISF